MARGSVLAFAMLGRIASAGPALAAKLVVQAALAATLAKGVRGAPGQTHHVGLATPASANACQVVSASSANCSRARSWGSTMPASTSASQRIRPRQ